MVAPTKQKQIPTDQELMNLPKDGFKRELLNGEIVMSPAGSAHGRLIMRFAYLLSNHVYEHALGEIYDGQTGFRMKSRDVLSPDISFVAGKRAATNERFFEGAPDLAIEFLSPRESKKRMAQKVGQYLENGTRLAWVMDPKTKTLTIHRPGKPPVTLTEGDELPGEEVVPGFIVPVHRIFHPK